MALLLLSCGKDLADLEPFPCAQDLSCPSSYICVDELLCHARQQCELVQSRATCGGSAPRCALISAADVGGVTAQCVRDNQSAPQEGAFCSAQPNGLFTSVDECAKGFVCYEEGTALGAKEPGGHCRRFCADDADCASGSRCVLAFPGTRFVEVTRGVCEPGCNPFGAACAAGEHCDAIPLLAGSGGAPACRTNGTAASGGSCATETCNAGLLCVPAIAPFQTVPTCRVPCDGTHPCAAGTCESSAYPVATPDGSLLGFCH